MAYEIKEETKILTAALLDVIDNQDLEDDQLVNVLGTLVGYFLAKKKKKRVTMHIDSGYVHMEIGTPNTKPLGRMDREEEKGTFDA